MANANSQVAKKDLTQIQEQQEAAQIAAELGAKWVGDIAKGMNWEEGSPQKVALHGLVGYLSAKVGSGNIAAGALSAMGSEYLNSQVSAYLKEHPELSPAQRKVIQQASALGIGAVIGVGLGGDNQVIKQSAQQALRTEVFNRQLHPKEMEWIKENAEKFAKAQGISQEEAEKRLITQAAQEVDFFWEKKIGTTDSAASHFLESASGFVNDIPERNPITFTNGQGKPQVLFTASEEERLATGLYADKLRTYDEKHAGRFTQAVQPNIHYNAVVSSAKEGVNNLAKAGAYTLDNPGAVMRQGIASAMDCAKTGDCIKEAWNQFDSASGRLLRNGYKQSDVDYLYGKSMQGEITAIEGARVAGTIAEFAPIGKGVKLLNQVKKYPSLGMDNYTRAKVGDVDYPESIHFNANLKEHLAKVDGFSQKSGIKGGHNQTNFEDELKRIGGRITKEIPGKIKGITTFEYEYPKFDGKGNMIGYKKASSPKTVYDPKIFSDEQILKWGQEAAAKGYNKLINSIDSRSRSESVNGIEFQFYINKETGEVMNVHPK